MIRYALLLAAALTANAVTVEKAPFHGWEDAVVLRNAVAQIVIVPSIGRVMEFGLIEQTGTGQAGPVWNNPALYGKPVDPQSATWLNFGGDKTWPAPQSDWPKIAPRSWPPPVAFDSAADTLEMPGTQALRPNQVALVSPVDPQYGIRARRVITLDETRPVMTIETTYTKVQGERMQVAVWVITQLRSPRRAGLALTRRASAADVRHLSETAPQGLTQQGNVIWLQRAADHPAKVGSPGNKLIWQGEDGSSLSIETRTPASHGGDQQWPDQGSHTEIYTSPDRDGTYVELETLGPLRWLAPGGTVSQFNTYTLARPRQ